MSWMKGDGLHGLCVCFSIAPVAPSPIISRSSASSNLLTLGRGQDSGGVHTTAGDRLVDSSGSKHLGAVIEGVCVGVERHE